jgi:imidazolonepropionase-like amidohydrolase
MEVEYARRQLAYQANKPTRLPFSPHPGIEALSTVLTEQNSRPIWIESGSCLMTNRAIKMGQKFNLSPVLIATGDEWRRPDLACSNLLSYISPLIFPALANLKEEDDWEQISLDQLRAWDHAPSNPALLAKKTKSLSITTTGTNFIEFHKNLLQAIERGLTQENALAALTINPAKLLGAEKYAGTLEKGKLANLFIVNGGTYFSKDVSIHSTWIKGRPFIHPVQKSQKNENTDSNASKIKKDQLIARFPSEDRKPIKMPSSILFTNATIWTCSMNGKLKNGEVFIKNGKISALGKTIKNLDRSKIKVIDLQGKHITPGIIDCHSHAMILGRVNESTLPSTAMVRIEDVINSESVNIERQLAGGVTTCNLLHGSANPIGGQNAVIKLRLGHPPEKLLIKEAPKGIKFALGENVKQANWGDKYTTRFPQSRMGVKTFFENRFLAAIAYEKNLLREASQGIPQKKNLELDAILEIIRGERLIHCHSYRQDEILVFLRTMEKFGVRVATLQHVLEGYKVADEIARHGAGASTFSDWWAYKFEVYDAIPYAGAIMHNRGCVVSFNSDSPDHARRMNLEAAKAVKYGGLTEMEALKFITLNPAKQLGIDKWVGSIEVGKDGDFAIWSGNPLDYRSKCEQTWIEGTLFYEIKTYKKRDLAKKRERDALIAKAKDTLNSGKQKDVSQSAKFKFFQHSLGTACDLFPHSCRSHENHKEGVHQ